MRTKNWQNSNKDDNTLAESVFFVRVLVSERGHIDKTGGAWCEIHNLISYKTV